MPWDLIEHAPAPPWRGTRSSPPRITDHINVDILTPSAPMVLLTATHSAGPATAVAHRQ